MTSTPSSPVGFGLAGTRGPLSPAPTKTIDCLSDRVVDDLKLVRDRAIWRHDVDSIAKRPKQHIAPGKEFSQFQAHSREIVRITGFKLKGCDRSDVPNVLDPGEAP